MKKYVYKPVPEVCSQQIVIEMDGETISSVTFSGGCSGGLQGVAKLVAGKTLDQAIEQLRGIDCGGKGTSCPDQLAIALTKIRAKQNRK